jgi:hypothetical protein
MRVLVDEHHMYTIASLILVAGGLMSSFGYREYENKPLSYYNI